MKHLLTRGVVVAIVAIVLCAGSAQAVEITWPEPNWPEMFEPNQLLTFYLTMDPGDWHDILHNSPGPDPPDCIQTEIERPAMFWMEGEEHLKIRVAVRRKKGFAFPNEANPEKVALKIDINQYYGVDPCAATEWHGMKKLSLEVNIDSIDVISEGVACNLHQMASAPEGDVGFYANWVKLYVNGNYIGIYTNAEQRDKTFLRHRDYYVSHDSWLYKHADCIPGFVLKVGDDDFPRSPALEALCYDPFVNTGDDPNLMPSGGVCSVPDDANVAADMNQWVDMKRLLTSQAVAAFLANSDSLFESENNTYFHDFNLADPCEIRKRIYIVWDVDSSFKSATRDIYYTSSSNTYEEVILQNPVFRSQYNQIMRDLLDGPFQFDDINDFLDTVEPVISSAVEADPQAMAHLSDRIGVSSAAEAFDWLRSWFSQRIPNVLAQVEFDDPTPPPGIILLQDGFEGAVWDANWTGTWVEDTSTYCRGASSAHAYKDNYGDFNCVALDTSDAAAVHVDFWLQKHKISSYTAKFYYYNGTTYDEVTDIDALGADDEWIHYTDTITDSNYFIPDFKIQFSATLSGGGPGRDVWVDDVVITKEVPSLALISGLILDPGAAPVVGVSVDANNAGGSDTTDIDGYYELEVTSGWSGTVTPTKTDYTFNPTSQSYTDVTTDQTNQDYVATSIYDLHPDGVINLRDIAVLCQNWLTIGPDGDLNDSGHVDLGDFALIASQW